MPADKNALFLGACILIGAGIIALGLRKPAERPTPQWAPMQRSESRDFKKGLQPIGGNRPNLVDQWNAERREKTETRFYEEATRQMRQN